MIRILSIVFLLLTATAVWTIPGDLNLDGKVDFEDFFLFADQFGKEGAPDTLQVSISDTVIVTKTDTIIQTFRDTFTVTNTDTLTITQLDTVFITERDTVPVVRRDTITQVIRDTVFLGGSDQTRPSIRDSWTDVIGEVEPAVYWIGVTAKPVGDTRFDVIFVGTGFAVTEWMVITNYHVGSAINDLLKTVRSDLEPVALAIRANTKIWGKGTYYLGEVTTDRNFLGFWNPQYDFTVSSPDIALFGLRDTQTNQWVSDLPYIPLCPLDDCRTLASGTELGILGFPGVLETNHSAFTLTPIPTFKTGFVSAIRPYNVNVSLDQAWKRALMGRLVQHSIETSPGNSGSPIFNKRGEVVAIHNSGIPGGESFNFGIRGDEIRIMLQTLLITSDLGTHPNAIKYLPQQDFE